jgi:iron-sulfur cluster repair protein YtfE (RIC family)
MTISRKRETVHVSARRTHPDESRREAFSAALLSLADELDAMSAAGDADVARLQQVCMATRTALQQHVVEAEADDGLLEQVVGEEPNLYARVEKMRSEHIDLGMQVNELLLALDSDRPCDELLAMTRDVLARINGHRHRATELLLDTYMLDFAAGD